MADVKSAVVTAQENSGQYDAVNPINMRDGIKIYSEALVLTPVAGDYVELLRCPSGTIISSIKIAHDDFGTAATIDIGVYTAPDPGVNIVAGDLLTDVDALCDASLGGTAKIVPTEILGFGNTAPEAIGLPLYALPGLALADDPDAEYVVAWEWQAVTAGVEGDIYVAIEYTTGMGAA